MPNDRPVAQAEQQKRAYRVIGTPRQKVDAAAKVTGAPRR